MNLARLANVVVLTLMVIGLTGCFSSNPSDIVAFRKPYEVDVTADKYILQPPDEIVVYCAKVPEIHDQRQKIRPDGKISFEGIGELEAAGKTPKELANDLRVKVLDLYKSEHVVENSIDLRIMSFQSKVYYVFGQVYEPGPRIYTGRDSVLTAIALAQPNPMAWIERIQIIRPSDNQNMKPKIFELNLDRLMAHGDTSKNVLLQEGDIIYVPPTILGWMALKVEEVIRPIARAFSGVYTVRRGMDSDRRYY
jgi:polysaccharide export outer membrane protein